jgi:hypothetical protein
MDLEQIRLKLQEFEKTRTKLERFDLGIKLRENSRFNPSWVELERLKKQGL